MPLLRWLDLTVDPDPEYGIVTSIPHPSLLPGGWISDGGTREIPQKTSSPLLPLATGSLNIFVYQTM
jgi:hypothetical protein